jgi:hypothetical protein
LLALFEKLILLGALSPRRINETSSWKLEQLREIWRYSDDMGDQITFVTSGGARHNWGHHAVEEVFSEKAALIWEM